MDCRALALICMMLAPFLVTSCDSGASRRPPAISFVPQRVPAVHKTTRELKRNVGIKADYQASNVGHRRKSKSMKPRFITIHSTANPTGDAAAHAKALKRGAGRMSDLNWHFTVDQYWAIQHVPLTETTKHADRNGPGDMYSISIEMCEVRSHRHEYTYNKTAMLTACLMKDFNIPLRNVVPHYYWSGKNCPRPLLDNGRPGQKWSWFISRVDYYYRCLNTPPPQPQQNNANASGAARPMPQAAQKVY